jgi:hypothetical protein
MEGVLVSSIGIALTVAMLQCTPSVLERLPLLCVCHNFDSICRKYMQNLYLQINLLKN